MNFDHYIFETLSPEVFGPKHLIGTFISSLLIIFFLIFTLKIYRENNHSKVLKFTAVFLLLLEITKYSYTFIVDGYFPLVYIPMQLCSFSLYLMPITAFSKGKIAAFFKPATFSVGLMAGLIVLVYPATVLGGTYNWSPIFGNVIPIISFTYHATMIFFSLYLIFSKSYIPNIIDYPKAFISLIAFALLASVTNIIFGTDMMFLNTASGSPFQFVLIEYGRLAYMALMLLLAMIILAIPFTPSIIKSISSGTNKNKHHATFKN